MYLVWKGEKDMRVKVCKFLEVSLKIILVYISEVLFELNFLNHDNTLY